MTTTLQTPRKMTPDDLVKLGMVVKPSKDRKTQARPSQKNTYGLLNGRDGTCPDATLGKGGCMHVAEGKKVATCYVDPLRRAYKNVDAVLAHNTYLFRNSDFEAQRKLLNEEFNRFRRIELRYDEPQLYYRLHWSGDFFDRQYVTAVAAAIKDNPDIHFWGYTRSFQTIPDIMEILDIPNLQMYLSLDPQNGEQGLATWEMHRKKNPESTWQVAWMGQAADYNALPETSKPRLSTCPELVGALPLQGACLTCQKCLGTRRSPVSILFTA